MEMKEILHGFWYVSLCMEDDLYSHTQYLEYTQDMKIKCQSKLHLPNNEQVVGHSKMWYATAYQTFIHRYTATED